MIFKKLQKAMVQRIRSRSNNSKAKLFLFGVRFVLKHKHEPDAQIIAKAERTFKSIKNGTLML